MAKEGKRFYKRFLLVVNVLALIALAAFGGYYFRKYQNLKNNPAPASQIAQEEVDRIIAKVDKLYSLPKDEKPSVATVKDKEKLKDQPFFDKAENDDITLIYSNAKLAILYRPSTDKIINVSSVTIQSSATVRVIGAAASRDNVEKILKENFANDVTVSGTGDAKNTYSGITIIDLSGQKGEVAKKLAEGLKGQVGTLPEGEDKPQGVDILIIAGS